MKDGVSSGVGLGELTSIGWWGGYAEDEDEITTLNLGAIVIDRDECQSRNRNSKWSFIVEVMTY